MNGDRKSLNIVRDDTDKSDYAYLAMSNYSGFGFFSFKTSGIAWESWSLVRPISKRRNSKNLCEERRHPTKWNQQTSKYGW